MIERAPSKIRRIPLDATSVELIAEVLAAEWSLAPFRLPNAAVYQVTILGQTGRPVTMLTIWPSLQRVDAVGLLATAVFTKVLTVDLVPDVEVQFRRATSEYLIVTRAGKIIVRA